MAASKITVFTIGYQGLTLERYVEALCDVGVTIVIDVRELPWSRKRGFSKTPLSAALSLASIDYLHVKSAGNPSSNRKGASSIAECLDLYREHIKCNSCSIEELLNTILLAHSQDHSVCLTCFEHSPSECHRSILVEEIMNRDPRIRVRHILSE